MNIAWLVIVALPLFFIAYRFYGRYLHRVFSNNEECPTPAVSKTDGVDFAPGRAPVVFSHHFASIAGAGPIIGPTVAMIYGYMPVWAWILLGTIFIGAVQDFATLFVSMREGGRSMAQVARTTLGRAGFFMVIMFSIIMLLLLTSAFLGLSATALTSMVPLPELHLDEAPKFLRISTGADGVARAHVGGIASMSVIIITLAAPLLGLLARRRQTGNGLIFAAALVVCALSVLFGMWHPLILQPMHWIVILTLYVLLASVTPVWMLLQPRDFVNSFLLYCGMALLIVGTVAGGLGGDLMRMPAFNAHAGDRALGNVWPFLFITVACGAISGFHAMVTGGTTSKQVARERQALPIGYGGMLLESILAILVVTAVGAGLSLTQFEGLVFPAAKGAASNPVLAFAMGMGGLLHRGLGMPMSYGTVFGLLMVEGFIVTTLDTATRLNRYLMQELWSVLFKTPPRWLLSNLFNSAIAALAMFFLCYTNTFKYIWPIFGGANQLMAALALIVTAAWLAARRRRNWFMLVPAVFMMATTIAALAQLLRNNYLPAHNYPLVVTAGLLILLGIGVVALAVRKHIFSR